MIEASKFQKSIIEQIEKIGDMINLIEGICKDIEDLDPILMNKIDYDDEEGNIYHHIQPILKFIINHRKYTLWYNEMRDSIFQELSNGAYIIKSDF